MGLKAKIDNSVLKRFGREERKRKENERTPKVYFLIICEGEKTEPSYFEGLKKRLTPNTIEIHIDGTGANTLSLVDKALKLKHRQNRHFDRMWLVFDKDSFPDSNFDNAIHKAISNGFQCAWSNEAFELWYLLHFQFVNNSMSREDYKEYLNREVRKKGFKSFSYQKNIENMYDILQEFGSEELAISCAKKLREKFTNEKFSEHNPCTNIDLLIEELKDPLKVLKGLIE